MRGHKTLPTAGQQRRPIARLSGAGTKKHGFSHPLMVELLEERLPLNSSPVATNASPAPMAASVPAAAAPTAAATNGAGAASGAEFPPISASGTPAVLLFDPHQPAGLIPADVVSGTGPPLQQGAPPRFSYNLETNITGEGSGAANEPLTAPSHSGSVTPNGVPAAETIRGLPFDVNQEAATPAGIPRFSFGPQTAPRSPLENRDLPGLRPGTAPSPSNRTNPTQPSESAPGTQPILPPANYEVMQGSDATPTAVAAGQNANQRELVMARIRPEEIAAAQPLSFDVVAAELATVMASAHAGAVAESDGQATERQAAALNAIELDAHDQTPSLEGALLSGALLTAARRPRQDSWPLDDVRRNFQWRSLERLSR